MSRKTLRRQKQRDMKSPTRPWRVFLCPVAYGPCVTAYVIISLGRDHDLESCNNSGADGHYCRIFLRWRICHRRLADGFPAGAAQFGQCLAVGIERPLRDGYRKNARCDGVAEDDHDHQGKKCRPGDERRIGSRGEAYESGSKNTIGAARGTRTSMRENDRRTGRICA